VESPCHIRALRLRPGPRGSPSCDLFALQSGGPGVRKQVQAQRAASVSPRRNLSSQRSMANRLHAPAAGGRSPSRESKHRRSLFQKTENRCGIMPWSSAAATQRQTRYKKNCFSICFDPRFVFTLARPGMQYTAPCHGRPGACKGPATDRPWRKAKRYGPPYTVGLFKREARPQVRRQRGLAVAGPRAPRPAPAHLEVRPTNQPDASINQPSALSAMVMASSRTSRRSPSAPAARARRVCPCVPLCVPRRPWVMFAAAGVHKRFVQNAVDTADASFLGGGGR
jgi:hypothetical protein